MLSFSDAFNLIVYTQPYLWLLLMNSRLKLSLYAFYFTGAATAALVAYTGFNRGFYTTDILLCYIFMVMAVVWKSRDAAPIQAVSFAFIMVFANSYYWEFPLHVASFVENPVVGNQLIQALHIVPLALLIYVYGIRLTVKPLKSCVESSLLVWMAVTAVVYIKMTFIGEGGWSFLLNDGLRWIALLSLTGLIKLKPETPRQ
jgi:hypothetical protein